MLALGIFMALLGVIAFIAAWYYFNWTPEGISKKTAALQKEAEQLSKVTKAQGKLEETVGAVGKFQEFNPVKNFMKGDINAKD